MLEKNRTPPPAERQDFNLTVDVRRIVKHVFAHIWWIIACTAVSTAAFSAAALFMRPVYRATATLMSAAADRGEGGASDASGALGGLASTIGVGSPHDADTEEALAVMRSREFTEAFITDKNLMPKLFPSKWDSALGRWNTDRQHQPTLAAAFRYFDQKIRFLSQDRKSELITLQIEWTDRAEAAAWAIELVTRVNEEMRARAAANADASLRFLQQELQGTSQVEIRNAVANLMEAQVKRRMIAHVTQDYSLRFVDRPVSTDGEQPIRPQKTLLFLLGPLAGLVLGVALVLVFRPMPRDEG